METCGKRCEKKTALHASMQQKKRKKKIRKKVVLKEKRSLNRGFTEHIIRVSDVDQLLQQFATFLVEHFADSRIVSNGE